MTDRWTLSRVVVLDERITTAASRDRAGRVVANYYAPIVDGRPVRPWALVRVTGTPESSIDTRVLPELGPLSPLSLLSRTERSALRELLDDALAFELREDDALWGHVLRELFVHLGHSTQRPRVGIPETHNTVHTDDFATDTAASWSPWSSSTWTHDAVNGERSIPSGAVLKGFRYSAGNSGSLDHEAQISGHLVGLGRYRLAGPAVRMSAAQRDAYVVDVHNRFPAIDFWRIVNGVAANLSNVFAQPAGYATEADEWLTLRLSASGAVGANVVLNLWAQTETTNAKPADPGWVGVSASPQWTYTDTAANRLDDAVHMDCGLAQSGGDALAIQKFDYFRLRSIADRAGADTTLAGAATGAATSSGALSTAIHFAGVAAGLALATATLATAIALSGSASGSAVATGELATRVELAGSADGIALATGELATRVELAGSADGSATATGELATRVELAGEAIGIATATGDLVAREALTLAGDAIGGAIASGDLETAITLSGTAAGVAVATADLDATDALPAEGGVRWPESMADVSLVELVETQAIAWLRADDRMETLVGDRIYTTVPPLVVYPFVLLEAFIVSPWNRLRGFGRSIVFQARAQSQVRGDYEVHRIADRISAIMEGRDIALPPAKRSLWSVDESPGASYTDMAAGVLTYHRPVSIRVRVQV